MPRLTREEINEVIKTVRTPLQVQMDMLDELRMIRELLEEILKK